LGSYTLIIAPMGEILHAKFHPHRCNVSPLWGEKPQNADLITGALHCTPCCRSVGN